MISRYEAYLNGVPLSSISADILVLDIAYAPPKPDDETFSYAKRNGSFIYNRYFDKYVVTISFEIHTYDVAQRHQICEAISAWARDGGELETNDKPGKRLHCVCSNYPSITSAKNWTKELKVEFTAYKIPFFEDINPTTVELTGTNTSSEVFIPGTSRGALVEAEITANASVSSFTLSVGERAMVLSGLSLSSGNKVKIEYDDQLIQHIVKGTTSLIGKRTGADDLLAVCGQKNTFGIQASASVTVVYSVRGLWT